MDTISNITPIPAPATVALSPLEELRAKIHDAERAFAKTLRTEFQAIWARVDKLDDEMHEAHFGNEHLRKLLGKVLKDLVEIVGTLSDGRGD